MVERLKDAIEKARAQRGDAPMRTAPPRAPNEGVAGNGPRPQDADPTARWAALSTISPSPKRLAAKRIVSLDKNAPEHAPFDVLRTRLLSVLKDNGWRKVAITSPTKNCGKSTICLNLAFSLARQSETRTLVIDFDMRAPMIAAILGVNPAPPLRDLIEGRVEPSAHLVRYDDNLAFALNSRRIEDSAEVLQSPRAAAVVEEMIAAYRPDVVLIDTCPMLIADDVISMLPLTDAVLMVAAGGLSKAHEIVECERLLEGRGRLLGVVLNRSEDASLAAYASQYDL